MNIVHINNTDLPGRRFNGYDMHLSLNAKGHNAKQFVTTKESDTPTVIRLRSPRDSLVLASIYALENTLGVDTLINPIGHALRNHPDFQTADIVHYHLIHNNLISLLDMPELMRLKPSLWTIHDPWAFTGGCIHPLSCEGWKRECGECGNNPTLRIPAEHTRNMLRLKREHFAKLNADIVVTSKFSESFVRESGVFGDGDKVRLHRIPFGIDAQEYTKISSGEARAGLNIPADNFVIAFRNESYVLKGCHFIYEALNALTAEKLTVLTVGSGAIPENITANMHTLELGWTNDPETLYSFYAACDIFLMPSLAESFGMMAIEAMAAGKPVVCFENTALYDVTFAPDCGFAVPYCDAAGLRFAIERLRDNKKERLHRGALGREFVLKYYSYDTYLARHIELYKEVLAGWSTRLF